MGNQPGGRSDEQGVRGEIAHDRRIGNLDLTRWDTASGRGLERTAQKASSRLGPVRALIVFLASGLALAVALTMAAAEVYDNVTDADGIAGLDQPLLDAALTLRSPVIDAVVTAYTDIAGPVGMPIIAVASLLVLSLRRRSWTPAILIVAAGGGSLLMTIAGKALLGRARPPLQSAVPPYEYSGSFPSGHTLNAVVVIGVIAYLLILRRKTQGVRVTLAIVAVLFAITIGLSRVFLGHHWFTDIVGGWLIGAAWLTLVITAHRLYLTTRAAPSRRAIPDPQ